MGLMSLLAATCERWQTDIGIFVVEVFEVAYNTYHCGIVGTELELRDEGLPMMAMTHLLESVAKIRVGTHASRYGQLANTRIEGCPF